MNADARTELAVVTSQSRAAWKVVASAQRLGTRALGIVSGLTLLCDVGLIFFGICWRAATGDAISWIYEVSTIMLVIIAFLGGAAAFWSNEHIRMEAARHVLPRRARALMESAGVVLSAVMAIVLTVQSVQLGHQAIDRLPATNLPVSYLYWVVAGGAAIIALRALLDVFAFPRLHLALFAGVVAAATLLWSVEARALPHVPPLAAGFVVLVFLLLTGMPVAFVLVGVGFSLLVLHPEIPLTAAPLEAVASVNIFTLLALPFFIFTGALLTASVVSERLMAFLGQLTAPVRGGTAIAGVAAMYLFSGLSGSKIADVGAVGPPLAPGMAREGHPPEEVVGVLSGSVAMGEAVPPSLAILVLSGITTVSTGALFAGGILPAIAVGLCLMVLVVIRARRHGLERGRRIDIVALGKAFVHAVPALSMLIVIFAGILLGVATPIEASAVAAVYGLLLVVGFYRVSPSRVLDIAIRGALVSGVVLFLLAMVGILVWVLTLDGIGPALARLTHPFESQPILLLLSTMVVVIIAGAIFEGLPALVVFAPLLLPVAVSAGVNPIQFSVMLVISMGIGSFLPPLGVGFYMIAEIVGVKSSWPAMRAAMAYLAAAVVGLVIIICIPAISTWLPRLLGLG